MSPKEYADKVQEHQDRQVSLTWMLNLLDKTRETIPMAHGTRILDFGCGPGRFTQMLSAPGADVLGVDQSSEMIEAARKNWPHARFETLPLPPSAKFDLIFMTNVLGHLPLPEKTLANLTARLERGGYLVLFNPNWTHTLLRKPIDRLKGYKPDPTLTWHWNKAEASRLVRGFGLEEIWSYRDGYSFFGVRSYYAIAFRKL